MTWHEREVGRDIKKEGGRSSMPRSTRLLSGWDCECLILPLPEATEEIISYHTNICGWLCLDSWSRKCVWWWSFRSCCLDSLRYNDRKQAFISKAFISTTQTLRSCVHLLFCPPEYLMSVIDGMALMGLFDSTAATKWLFSVLLNLWINLLIIFEVNGSV